jgi:hypothetical protein
MNDEITLSALVVLRPHRIPSSRGGAGERAGPEKPLARESLEVVTEFFARTGFAIGDTIGTSFWIKSRARNFEDLFGQTVEIQRLRNRVVSARLVDGSTEFSLALLPGTITRHLLAVTFTEPLISQWAGEVSEETTTAG